MKQLIIIAFLLMPSLPATMFAQEQEVDWEEECAVLSRELQKRHPDLFFNGDSAAFLSRLENIGTEAEGKDKLVIALEMQQALACLGDANTKINYHFLIGREQILPLKLYYFEEGLMVMNCDAGAKGLEGRKILSINGYPLEQVRDSLKSLMAHPEPAQLKARLPLMLTWVPVLRYFGFAPTNRVEIEAVDDSGQKESFVLVPSARSDQLAEVQASRLPVSWQNRREYFHHLYLAEEKLCYIQYNKCWSREVEEDFGSGASALFMPSYREFEKDLLRSLKKNDVEKVVLDLRFNNGGRPEQGQWLIQKLEKAKIGKKSAVFLVIGRETEGAAMDNAVEIMKTFQATLVGEASGGKPNQYGEPGRFFLTASGLVISCSSRYISLMDENSPALHPEIQTPESFRAYMMGLDPALRAIEDQSPEVH